MNETTTYVSMGSFAVPVTFRTPADKEGMETTRQATETAAVEATAEVSEG